MIFQYFFSAFCPSKKGQYKGQASSGVGGGASGGAWRIQYKQKRKLFAKIK